VLLLRIPEQRAVDTTHETEDRGTERLVASEIALIIRGDKKPSRSNRSTERLSQCSRRAISSNRIGLFRDQLERPSPCAANRLAQR